MFYDLIQNNPSIITRSLQWGEQVFVTMYINENGYPLYWDKHKERLIINSHFLFQIEQSKIKLQVDDFYKKYFPIKDAPGIARIRIFWREDFPHLFLRSKNNSNQVQLILDYRQDKNINHCNVEDFLNGKRIYLNSTFSQYKHYSDPHWPQTLKIPNYTQYIYEKNKYSEYDEFLRESIFKNWGIVEGRINNIFLKNKKGEFITPPLTYGIYDGIMRTFFIKEITKRNIPINFATIHRKDVLNKNNSIYLTNALHGIRQAIIKPSKS